jgi:glyoxylase-like metal-dependent hydrolase (beta-lactamase superfamily II)
MTIMALITLDPTQARIAALRLQIANREAALDELIARDGDGEPSDEQADVWEQLRDLAAELDELIAPGHKARVDALIETMRPQIEAKVAELLASADLGEIAEH